MGKSLLKLLLLGALSAGASSLPNMLGGLSALPAAPLSGLPAAGASGENARETARELADLQRTVEELKGLNSARPKSVAGLSEEERGLMQDAAPKLKFKSNALTRQLGLAGGGKRAGPSPAALPGAAGEVMKRFKDRTPPKFQSFRISGPTCWRFTESARPPWHTPSGSSPLRWSYSPSCFTCGRNTPSA